MANHSLKSLRESLEYEPQILKFGTSGRRGNVSDLTQLEVYINATAELEYLQSLPHRMGGSSAAKSSALPTISGPAPTGLFPNNPGRGEIAQAIERAIRDAGMRPANLGRIPTPALASYSLEREQGSMMVTGSHIPFERNGYKTNTSRGELLKRMKPPSNDAWRKCGRDSMHSHAENPFLIARASSGAGTRSLRPKPTPAGKATFGATRGSTKEARCVACGCWPISTRRSAATSWLRSWNSSAQRSSRGRSESFVPIDTENIDEEQLAMIQALASDHWRSKADSTPSFRRMETATGRSF